MYACLPQVNGFDCLYYLIPAQPAHTEISTFVNAREVILKHINMLKSNERRRLERKALKFDGRVETSSSNITRERQDSQAMLVLAESK